MRIDRNLNRHRDDERDPGSQPESQKNAGQSSRRDDFNSLLQGRQTQDASDFDQARLDSAHRGARQNQERPEARDRDNDDFEPVTEAKRHESDWDHRH